MKCHDLLGFQQKWKFDFLNLLESGQLSPSWLASNHEIMTIKKWLVDAKETPLSEAPQLQERADNFAMLLASTKLLINFVKEGRFLTELNNELSAFNLYRMRVVRNLSKLRKYDDVMDQVSMQKQEDINPVFSFPALHETSTNVYTHVDSVPSTESPSFVGFIKYLA